MPRRLRGLPADTRARALSHVTTETLVDPTPLLPIPTAQAQTWHVLQNPGYNWLLASPRLPKNALLSTAREGVLW